MEICLIQFQYYVEKSSSYLDSMDNHLQGNGLRNRNRVILCSCYAVVVLKVHFGPWIISGFSSIKSRPMAQ